MASCVLLCVSVSSLIGVDIVLSNFLNILDGFGKDKFSIWLSSLGVLIEFLSGLKCSLELLGSINSLESSGELVKDWLSVGEVLAGPEVCLVRVGHWFELT